MSEALLEPSGRDLDDESERLEADRERARIALTRDRTWLGRELLTWLLWKSDAGDVVAHVDGEDVTVLLTGPVTLQGVAGDATELRAKGYYAAYAKVVRQALAKGLLIHQARLRFVSGPTEDERLYEVTLDAEQFAFRQVRLPQILSEEPDEALLERLALTDHVCALVDAVWASFVEIRSTSEWENEIVPAIRAWFDEASELTS